MDDRECPFRNNTLLVVTGAAGFMGEWALRFAQQCYPLVLVADFQKVAVPVTENSRCLFQFIKTDITKQSDLERLRGKIEDVLRENPGMRLVFFHMAAIFSYDEKKAPRDLLYRVNTQGTMNVLEFVVYPLIEHLRSFVYWSGATEYGDAESVEVVVESAPKKPTNEYGWTKLYAADGLRRIGRIENIPIVIMELTGVYGPGGPKDQRYGMAKAIKMVSKGPNIAIGMKPRGAPLVHAEDVIRVADFLAHCPEAQGETYLVVDNGDLRNTDEVSEMLGVILGNPLKRFPRIPMPVFRRVILPALRFFHKLFKLEIDPGLAEIGTLDITVSGEKLEALAKKYGRGRDSGNPLMKWRARDGLEHTVNEYRKEGFIK